MMSKKISYTKKERKKERMKERKKILTSTELLINWQCSITSKKTSYVKEKKEKNKNKN